MNGIMGILLHELCLLFDLLVCFGVPLGGILRLRKKGIPIGRPFLLGVLAFVISQLVLRVPIVQKVLPNMTWFLIMQQNPWLYGFFLGATAGIFEEVARLLFMKYGMKGRTEFSDGLAFGLGHGGIEAMMLVGLSVISSMVLIALGEVEVSLISYSSLLLGGVERIGAMTFHIGATLVILYGIRQRKGGRFTLLAILLHTILDASVVILPRVFGVGVIELEGVIMIIAVITLVMGIRLMERSA